MGAAVGWSARQKGYLVVRGGAALVFVGAATLMERGTAAGLVCLAAGAVGALSCIGTNAGGTGEQAGAWAEQQRVARFRAPQGDWPPYAEDDRPPG
jgi:hypothetical protein